MTALGPLSPAALFGRLAAAACPTCAAQRAATLAHAATPLVHLLTAHAAPHSGSAGHILQAHAALSHVSSIYDLISFSIFQHQCFNHLHLSILHFSFATFVALQFFAILAQFLARGSTRTGIHTHAGCASGMAPPGLSCARPPGQAWDTAQTTHPGAIPANALMFI